MSRYLGRIRRVYTGWRAVPGKNLVVFDDCLVQARASAFDGVTVGGGEMGRAVRSRAANTNKGLDELSPEELVSQHADNWQVGMSDIKLATLDKKGVALLGGRRRLRLDTGSGERVVEWEQGANNDPQVVNLLKQALGDRLSVTK